MIWLLAQIGLCLLLAAIAGWFIGWHLRGFRDQDKVEDLRQTMLATKDVNEREVGDARRRIEELETKLARAEADAAARSRDAEPVDEGIEPGNGEAVSREDPTIAATLVEIVRETEDGELEVSVQDPQPDAPPELAAAERERRREAESALRRKTAAVLSLQAELEALREAVGAKSAEIAELEERLAEQAVRSDAEGGSSAELEDLREQHRALQARADQATRDLEARNKEVEQLRNDLSARETRLNELRNRIASLETELAAAKELGGDPTAAAATERDLEETRRALQRQIERNRKQEAVHRAVVEQLEAEKSELRRNGTGPNSEVSVAQKFAAVPPPQEASTASPSTTRPSGPPDELTAIRGIGPAFAKELREAGITTFTQIAAWTDADVQRYAKVLQTHAKRIHGDAWIDQARRLAVAAAAT